MLIVTFILYGLAIPYRYLLSRMVLVAFCPEAIHKSLVFFFLLPYANFRSVVFRPFSFPGRGRLPGFCCIGRCLALPNLVSFFFIQCWSRRLLFEFPTVLYFNNTILSDSIYMVRVTLVCKHICVSDTLLFSDRYLLDIWYPFIYNLKVRWPLIYLYLMIST